MRSQSRLAQLLTAAAAVGVVVSVAVGAAAGSSLTWLALLAAGVAALAVIGLLALGVRGVLRESGQSAKTRAAVRTAAAESAKRNAQLLGELRAMAATLGASRNGVDDIRAAVGELADAMVAVVSTLRSDSAALRREVGDADATLRRDLTEEVRGQATRLYAQLEAAVALYSTLDLDRPLPSMSGWALSPDAAVDLVARVEARRPTTIVECGSGASTVLFALLQQRLGIDGRVVALEHDPHWADATRDVLVRHGLQDRATVVDAPLVDVEIGDESYHWYDLAGLDVEGVDLLFVDGPPAKTGHMARFPAVPLLADRLSPDAVVVLDDARRPDERDVVQAWLGLDPAFSLESVETVRGTAVLTRTSRDARS